MKNLKLALVATLFILLGGGTVYTFEFHLADKIDTTKVIVAKKDIGFKEPITKDHIAIKAIKRDNVVKDAYKPEDINLVLEKFASVEIKKGTQLYPALIDTYDLVPDVEKGEFIAPIPSEWIYAVPGSLRRTYIADIYAIPDEEQKLLRSLAKDSEQHSHDSEEQTENNESESQDKPLETTKTLEDLVQNDREPVLTNVRVSAVKDGSNREVEEVEGKQVAGKITNVEIIANQDMLNTLKDHAEEGYKFLIVYRFDMKPEGEENESTTTQ